MAILYVGRILNEHLETRLLFHAENDQDAKAQVLERMKDSLNVYFREDEVEVYPFSERNLH